MEICLVAWRARLRAASTAFAITAIAGCALESQGNATAERECSGPNEVPDLRSSVRRTHDRVVLHHRHRGRRSALRRLGCVDPKGIPVDFSVNLKLPRMLLQRRLWAYDRVRIRL